MASTANSQSVFNVFVYGSLLADDVVHALLKRVPPSNPAILHNYHRFSIKGRVYPAILPVENKKVTGKDSSKTLQAETYVWVDKKDPNLFGEWDFEEWKQLHKGDFLKMTMGFSEELELPDSKTSVATYESFYAQEENKSKP
ncbi:PREDICTED: AIG2-like protein D isoform X2 [Nicotiana attenuata]|uniref:AIG2-like protein D isoform X2 n=1 Tax=Nicotiana attenuata TaxID=49451 RepID=UPI0009045F92|nr:PREDICTED: AIG2-like protein D isoform X2 [Nicotiana attenuata]